MKAFKRIDFERSGGFSGIPLRVILNKRLLNPEEFQELSKILHDAGIYNFPLSDAGAVNGPDQFVYRITVETAHQKYVVTMHEGQLTPGLRLLVRYLTKRAFRSVKQ